jgi:hypothetical protein
MTLVELSIGLVVTSLVMAALGALWFAVARAWTGAALPQGAALTGNVAVARIESTIRAARHVCRWHPGAADGGATPAASVFFWRADDWGAADRAVQFAELALIEHDPAARRLYLYEALPAAAMTADQRQRASIVPTWAEMSAAGTPAAFKAYDFVRRKVVTEAVTGALFNVPVPTRGARPALEFTLTLSRAGGDARLYGLATMRAPSTRPTY